MTFETRLGNLMSDVRHVNEKIIDREHKITELHTSSNVQLTLSVVALEILLQTLLQKLIHLFSCRLHLKPKKWKGKSVEKMLLLPVYNRFWARLTRIYSLNIL